jgi:hypothetical protein
LGGASYIATFVDDYSRYAIVRLLARKSDAPNAVKTVIALLENQTNLSLKAVRTDRGGEYLNAELDSYFAGKGVRHQLTCPHTPQQNGVAERFNRTLLSKVRCMMVQAGVPAEFWGEAVSTVCTLHNVTPSSATSFHTPWELVFRAKPNVEWLRVFGCTAYVTLDSVHRRKLDPPGAKGVFLGYEVDCKAYRVYLLDRKQVVVSRDVRCVETEFPFAGTATEVNPFQILEPGFLLDLLTESTPPDSDPPAPFPAPQLDMFDSDDDSAFADAREVPVSPSPVRPTVPAQSVVTRAGRAVTAPVRFDPHPAAHISVLPPDPNSYREAMAAPDAARWLEAMDEELASLRDNSTWELVPRPAGVKPIKCRWVFKKKFLADGSLERYKARLVAKGFLQKEGIDYEEVFAPVSKHATLRVLLSIVAAEDLHLRHWDVRTAFLYGDVEEELYIEQPEGFCDNPTLVCRLRKALYGLKQAPRAWHLKLKSELESLGFTASDADPTLFVLQHPKGNLYISVYVDDLLPATQNVPLLASVQAHLSSVFKIRDLGDATFFLGMEINRERGAGTLALSQHKLIHEIVTQFGVGGDESKSTPLPVPIKLVPCTDEELTDEPYRELVGKLLYVANCTRPDIAHSVGVLCRFMSKPGHKHWHAALRVARYLAGTAHYALIYSKNAISKLIGYCDSDHAGDLEQRRSTTGYVFIIGGAAVSWSSRLQQTVAVSTAEAEYMAAAACVKEAVWIRTLLDAFGMHVRTLPLLCDNQAAISLLKNAQASQRSKHIDIIYHFARQRVQRGEVSFSYVPSKANVADAFTKALEPGLFAACVNGMGLK